MQEELLKQKEAHLVSYPVVCIPIRDHTLYWMLLYDEYYPICCLQWIPVVPSVPLFKK